MPPGIWRLNDLFTRHNLNIHAQFMQSHKDIGYVVLDVDSPVADPVRILEEIRALPNTIRARLLNRV